jgi:hypothetical protein
MNPTHTRLDIAHPLRRLGLTGLLPLLCLVVLALRSEAQLIVNMTLDKKMYVAYEPIRVQVKVTNQAGRDVVLGGPAGSSWLNFDVANTKGEPILPSGRTPFAASTVLSAGKSITQEISLGKAYALGLPRNYRVNASVYFAGTGKYISSRPVIFSITEAKTVWDQIIGIPRGKPGGGYRRYQLLSSYDTKRTQLYVRVTNKESGRVLATYSIGRFIPVVNPQATIDGENRMHVLFLGAPHTYSHKTINYDGETLTSDIYRDAGARPELVESSDGVVRVRGGLLFDPSAPNPADAIRGARDLIRRLSDRPEGLPYVPIK